MRRYFVKVLNMLTTREEMLAFPQANSTRVLNIPTSGRATQNMELKL